MNTHLRIPVLLLAVLLAAGSVPAHAQSGNDATVERHAAEVMGAGHLVQQVFGPMPALAGTPFLGLAVLSGAALLSDSDAVRNSDSAFVRGFHDNALLSEARRYATPGLFFGLLALSLLTWLANSGKIRGAVGKLLRVAEDSSVLVTYGLLAMVTFFGASHAPAPKIAAMGFWNLPGDVLLAVGLALALGVMMTVRFAFDVLIWLSPFPMVDFTFETLKKVLSLAFLAVYFLSPTAASVLGLMVLIPALFLYGWAVRILSFTFRVVLQPLFARLFHEPVPDIVDEGLRARFAPDGQEADIAVPAAALSVRGIHRRTHGVLLHTAQGLSFVSATPFRHRRVALPGRPALAKTLLWLELRVTQPDGRVDRIAIPRTYAPDFDRLRALLAADDAGTLGLVRAFGKMADGVERWTVPADPGAVT